MTSIVFTASSATVLDWSEKEGTEVKSTFIAGEDIRSVSYSSTTAPGIQQGISDPILTPFLVEVVTRQDQRVRILLPVSSPQWKGNLDGAIEARDAFLAIAGITGSSVVPDGVYGQITVSGGGSVWTINSTGQPSGLVLTTDGADGTTWSVPTGGGITALTGDGTATGPGSAAFTLATVNGNVGTFGSASQAMIATFNAKGLVTSVSQTTITAAAGSLTGLGAGVAAALAVNIGSAGAMVLFNGAGGTPSSLTLTNATGLPIGGITGLGTGVATALAIAIGSAGAFVTFNGAGGTPSSINLTNGTSLPISTGVSGLGTGVATALAQAANTASGFITQTGGDARYIPVARPNIAILPTQTGTAPTWTAMPAALTFFLGQNRWQVNADLTGAKQIRFSVNMSATVGFAGSKLLVRYRTFAAGLSTVATDFIELGSGSTEVEAAIDTAGPAATTSGYIDITAAAKTTVIIALLGIGGNGVVAPIFLNANIDIEYAP